MKTLAFLGILAGAMIVSATADAQDPEMTRYRYCVNSPGAGSLNCRFETLEQCKASYSQGSGGGGNSCMLNPYFREQK